MENLGKITALSIYLTSITMARGWVLSILWNWFMTTLGVTSIGVSQGVGIALIVAFIAKDNSSSGKDYTIKEIIKKSAPINVVIILMALFTGWIVQFFL